MEQELQLLEELMKMADENNLNELSIKFGALSATIKKRCPNQQVIPEHLLAKMIAYPTENTLQAENTLQESLHLSSNKEKSSIRSIETKLPTNLVKVTSPLAGVFYISPSPTANPFVEIGQVVPHGQILCIIEAMKIMNEIPSEVGGVIVQVLVENGTVVEEGETLFLIDRDGA